MADVVAERKLMRDELEAADREAAPLFASYFAAMPPDTQRSTDDAAQSEVVLSRFALTSPPAARYFGAGGKEIRKSFRAGPLGRLSVVVSWSSAQIQISWEVSSVPTKTRMLVQFRDPVSRTPLSELLDAGPLARRRWSISSKELGFSPRKRWMLELTTVKS
jgi:hypothetical protein